MQDPACLCTDIAALNSLTNVTKRTCLCCFEGRHEKGTQDGCVRVSCLGANWSHISVNCMQEARTSVVKASTEDPPVLAQYQDFLQVHKCGSSIIEQNPPRYHQ